MRREKLAALRAAVGPTEATRWPTCALCTDATAIGGVAFERWIPVDAYRVEPEVFRKVRLLGHSAGLPGAPDVEVADVLNPPRKLGTRGWFTVLAECHGRETWAEIDVPYYWGVHHVRAAIQSLAFFGADTKPEHGLKRLTG